MTEKNLISLLESYKEWEALQEEAAAVLEDLKNQIKNEMVARDTEELVVDKFVCRFTVVQSSRFDTKRFKAELGEELYKNFCKEVVSRRFSVS